MFPTEQEIREQLEAELRSRAPDLVIDGAVGRIIDDTAKELARQYARAAAIVEQSVPAPLPSFDILEMLAEDHPPESISAYLERRPRWTPR